MSAQPPIALGPGEIIGRNPNAGLTVDDASVSEAHALISLREGALVMLGLRGVFTVNRTGAPCKRVELTPGMTIQLSRLVELTVEDVRLPIQVLTLNGGGLQAQMLASVGSLVAQRDGRIVYEARFRNRALAHLWSYGDTWQLRVGEGPIRDVVQGDRFDVQGTVFEIGGLALQQVSQHETSVADAINPSLRIVAMYDTVKIERTGQPTVTLTHTAARVISELVQFAEPVHWELVAREVWPREQDALVLRGRWDVCLRRLRQRLKANGVRDDLVDNNAGTIQLMLRPGDTTEDRC